MMLCWKNARAKGPPTEAVLECGRWAEPPPFTPNQTSCDNQNLSTG
jgi:hypothetical protein